MRTLGILATVILLGLAGVFAWEAVQRNRQPVAIRFVITSWPTSQLMRAVESRGYFAARGITVELIDVGNDHEAAVTMLEEGAVDGGVFVYSEPLVLAAGGKPMSVVLNIAYSSGADGIVVSDAVADLADLRGRRIAYQPGSFGDLLLQEALGRSGLSLDDVIPVALNTSGVAQAFLQEEVAAAVTFQPFLEQALRRTNSRLLFSSAEVPGLIPDVVTFRRDYRETHEVAITAFLNAWFDALHDLRENRQARREMLAVVAVTTGSTIVDVERQLKGIKLISFDENAVAFTYADDFLSLYRSGERFLQFFSIASRTGGQALVDEVLDPTFIRRGLRSTEAPVDARLCIDAATCE